MSSNPPTEDLLTAHRRRVGHSRSPSWPKEWVSDVATRDSVWSLLSFFELPINVAQSIRNQLPPVVHEGYPVSDFQYTFANAGVVKRKVPVRVDVGDDASITSAANTVSVCVRHARAYMLAAASSQNTVKPTFLYYGCLALSRAVVASILAISSFAASHGIGFDRPSRRITVFPDGELADLHDATFTIPSFYLNRQYALDEVVRVLPGGDAAMKRVGSRDQHRVAVIPDCPSQSDIAGHDFTAHLVTWEMIAIFALSNFSRYDPDGWERILRGDPDGRAHAYSVFMEEVEISFPLHVARLLSGTNYTYGPSPAAREQIESMIEQQIGQTFRAI